MPLRHSVGLRTCSACHDGPPTHPPTNPTPPPPTHAPARWNGWNLLRHAVQDPASVTQKFQQAQASSLNVVRFFLMGGDDDGSPLLLSGPGAQGWRGEGSAAGCGTSGVPGAVLHRMLLTCFCLRSSRGLGEFGRASLDNHTILPPPLPLLQTSSTSRWPAGWTSCWPRPPSTASRPPSPSSTCGSRRGCRCLRSGEGAAGG